MIVTCEVRCEGTNVLTLAGATSQPSCGRQLFRGTRKVRGTYVWVPKLVVERHCDAPVRHGALRVGSGYFAEGFFRGSVSKRVKQGDCSFKLRLHRCRAGGRERYGSEFLWSR